MPKATATSERSDMARIVDCGVLRRSRGTTRCVFDGMAAASDMIGTLSHKEDVLGFTKGQFSLADLLAAILDQTGPAECKVCTWTAADSDLRSCFALLHHGHLTGLRFVFDYGIESCRDYMDAIVEEFGWESFRVTRTHAKFAIVRNAEWSIAIRSSMNFNWNPRFEFFEISDNAEVCGFLENVFDQAFERGARLGASISEARSLFIDFDLGGGAKPDGW